MAEFQDTKLTFLGTGGGRFATMYQTRATGGIYISDNGLRLHIDPGPTAAYNLRRASISPENTDAILVSHCHPDHYSDAEILVEGMCSGGMKKKGTVFGSTSVIFGEGGFDPPISKYHKSICSRVSAVSSGDSFRMGDMVIDATPTQHSDPFGVGFKLHTKNGIISYVGDSDLSEEIMDAHRGARVLILNVTRPLNSKVSGHLCTEEAAVFAKEILPEVTLLTHLGLKFVKDDPYTQAKYIEKNSGVRTIAAEDLMEVSIGDEIAVRCFYETQSKL